MKRLVLLVAAVLCVGMLASPVAAQQSGTPTDDATTEQGTEATNQSTPDIPVQSPSGSPVTYNSPTPTEGEGPGFGVVGALVAAALAAVLAVRREG